MIFSAIALGLSMGCLCLGHCLPILAPLMLSREGATVKDSSLYLGLFLLGKFISYLLFGLIVGVLGQYAIRPIFLQNTIIPVLFLILGIFM
ncbi:MAG: sulfite exporter TauE/SafE family protein, partial [Candidatus Omnitrophica bacterium]|nr:sulfite exporter TauE/SafE family protein [Candidatus Omnitrophota bacterium]